eukprot:gnl/Chilomastix_cuspidata/1031.p1 GENE.gnl/Chilomastix_cuspidata/1031~~gnl/Chilomastix_cuspidata/1031.p1  ORF type:complete len:338 (+),score=88.47 gnl/Chilomastix_cuspidata/1031:361-1374(+)
MGFRRLFIGVRQRRGAVAVSVRNCRMLEEIPRVGLGTWKSRPGEVAAAVHTAIRVGYRHIDCAAVYGNEKEVGEGIARAISEGIVVREDLWITSKLWPTHVREDLMSEMLDQTLADLGVGYLDLYLLHWPIPMVRGATPGAPAEKCADGSIRVAPEVDLVRVWHSMEALVDGGRVRRIGLCNTPAALLMFVLANCRVRPYLNQFERNLHCPAAVLAGFCVRHGVRVTGFRPFGCPGYPIEGAPDLLAGAEVRRVAAKHGVAPPVAALAWSVARGRGMLSVVFKSTNAEHIKDNLRAATLELDEEDVALLDSVVKRRPFRYSNPGRIFSLPYMPEEVK